MISIRKHRNQIAEHMRRRWKAVQEQNGGSIRGTGFAIKDFQPLRVKLAIENGRRNRVRHLNSPSVHKLNLRGHQAIPESSRKNADDRLALDPLGPVEGGDGVIEGRYFADVRPQPSVTQPPDDLTQLGAIGLDNEVDRQAVGGPRFGRPDDGHQCSSGSNQTRGALRDVAAEDIENQIDSADVFQRVVLKADELLCTEVESLLTVSSASGADDVGPGVTCERGCHRTDSAGRAVYEHALPRTKAAVLEQSLPRREARHREGCAR